MPRFLVIIAVVAVSLAVGAVIAVAVVKMGGEPAQPPAETPRATVAAEPADEEPSVPIPAVTRRPKAPKPAVDATQPAEPGDAAALEAPADDERVARFRDMVANMSSDDRQLLMREIMRQRGREMAERRKYDLPSDRRLRRLERTRDDNLRLTDAQREQIDAIRDTYKPQLDAQLQDIWAQQAELREDAMALMSEGKRDEARALFEQMNELNQQADQLKAPLDEQYKAALASILTPEQTAEMAQERDTSGRRGGRRGAGGFGGMMPPNP